MENKIKVKITGLHCKACEILSEDALKRVAGVTRAKVSQKTGEAEIFYQEKNVPVLSEIKTSLEEIGYGVKDNNENKNKTGNYSWIILILAIFVVYWFISLYSLPDFSSFLGQGEFSFSLALLVGLVAGVSTCLALVGGLIFGLSANYAKEHPEATHFQKFQPHLLFNLGRIGGFFILGGILGLIGSTFKLSPIFNGLLIILAGLTILFLGLKLLDIPAFNDLEISLPKNFGRAFKTKNALLLGALTFFLPCGFTQAMQIYALGTGNFLSGGLVMALFALGTAPGLLGLGGLASLIKKGKSNLFFKIAGGIIIIFALFNLNNGSRLIQISGADDFTATNKTIDNSSLTLSPGVEIKDGVQIVTMSETNRGYSPDNFTIIKNMPVRLVIKAEAPYSCASSLIIPSLKLQKQLKPGENIIEFTPAKTGSIPFSCSMGMYTGSFTVIEK